MSLVLIPAAVRSATRNGHPGRVSVVGLGPAGPDWLTPDAHAESLGHPHLPVAHAESHPVPDIPDANAKSFHLAALPVAIAESVAYDDLLAGPKSLRHAEFIRHREFLRHRDDRHPDGLPGTAAPRRGGAHAEEVVRRRCDEPRFCNGTAH